MSDVQKRFGLFDAMAFLPFGLVLLGLSSIVAIFMLIAGSFLLVGEAAKLVTVYIPEKIRENAKREILDELDKKRLRRRRIKVLEYFYKVLRGQRSKGVIKAIFGRHDRPNLKLYTDEELENAYNKTRCLFFSEDSWRDGIQKALASDSTNRQVLSDVGERAP